MNEQFKRCNLWWIQWIRLCQAKLEDGVRLKSQALDNSYPWNGDIIIITWQFAQASRLTGFKKRFAVQPYDGPNIAPTLLDAQIAPAQMGHCKSCARWPPDVQIAQAHQSAHGSCMCLHSQKCLRKYMSCTCTWTRESISISNPQASKDGQNNA